MSLTPVEAADLAAKLANADKVRAETEKVRAEAAGERADADKTRADADKVRAENEDARLLQKNKQDVAAADLEAKNLANQKASSEARDARTTKLVEQLTGAVPDLSSLGKSTVTFAEGKALRQGETVALALDRVAAKIAEEVRPALTRDGTATVFVTSETRIVAALASYWQLKDEADLLKAAITAAQLAAEDALNDSEPAGVKRQLIAAQAGLVAAAVAGKAVTQVASLFELEVAVTTGETDIPAETVHAAVIHELLHQQDGQPKVTVQHQWARIPGGGQSPLREDLKNLIEQDITTAVLDEKLQARIDELGDPTAKPSGSHRVAGHEAGSEEGQLDAESSAAEATEQLEKLTRVKTAQQVLSATATKVKAFADRISTVSAGGESPLMAAYSIEPLTAGAGAPSVLVLAGAKAETFQMLIKRRIFAPRLQVSTTIEVDYFLVKGVDVITSNHATASVSHHGLITRRGSSWKTVENLTMAEERNAPVPEPRLSAKEIAVLRQLVQERPAAAIARHRK